MKQDLVPYEKQIFVCTNNAKGEKPSCGGDSCGEEIFRALRNLAKERGFHPRVRVARARCLGKCGLGANIMVYPDNIWYSGVTLADVHELAQKYF
jgi:(2Fe-2S) ferredoxin